MTQARSRHSHALLGISLLLGLLLSASAASIEAGAKSLREAVRAKEIVSLESIMNWIEERYYGQIVEVELENEEGYFGYEVDLLSPTHSKIEFRFDARTGELISVSGRDIEKARRK